MKQALEHRHDACSTLQRQHDAQNEAGGHAEPADRETLGDEDLAELRGEAPKVRRIAISVRLSLTTMTSIATMLKAATATISSRISAIMVFSMRMARK